MICICEGLCAILESFEKHRNHLKNQIVPNDFIRIFVQNLVHEILRNFPIILKLVYNFV